MLPDLIQKIKAVADFSSEEITFFGSRLEKHIVLKGDHVLEEGQVTHFLSYMEKGLAMYYRIHEGVEIPTDFAAEGEWFGSMHSFTNRIPSEVNIKALEEIHCWRLSYNGFKEIVAYQPKFILLKDYYTQLSFTSNTRHTADLAMLPAKQRYEKFRDEKPDLLNRVPQYYVAAYLGIKPQSLSRLRK